MKKIQENNNSIYKVYPWDIPCIYLHWVIYMVYSWYIPWIYHVKYLLGFQMDMVCDKGHYTSDLYYLHIQSLFPADAMAIMMCSPAPLTPT